MKDSVVTCDWLIWVSSIATIVGAIITVAAFLVALFAYRGWKNNHRKERESNYYLNILHEIIQLRYSILELRRPRFISKQETDLNKEILENHIPFIEEIRKKSSSILNKISIWEETISDHSSADKKYLTLLFSNKIHKDIIGKITQKVYLYFYNVHEGKSVNSDLYKYIFPSENRDVPLPFTRDDTGLEIINDAEYKHINDSFNAVIIKIREKLI
jgi:hypothetical protein